MNKSKINPGHYWTKQNGEWSIIKIVDSMDDIEDGGFQHCVYYIGQGSRKCLNYIDTFISVCGADD